mgnify:CR=1 FL=1
MFILYLGLIIGLVYGGFEMYDLVKDVLMNGWNWDLIREGFRGISLAALELAVLGQSYVVTRYFIKDEDMKAAQSKNIDL